MSKRKREEEAVQARSFATADPAKRLLAREKDTCRPKGGLCLQCRKLDLDRIQGMRYTTFCTPAEPEYGVSVARLGSQLCLKTAATDCVMCSMFSSTLDASSSIYWPFAGFELRAYPFYCDMWPTPRVINKDDHPCVDQVCLAVIPVQPRSSSQALSARDELESVLLCTNSARLSDTVFSPRRIHPRFEASIAKEWLKYCKESHTGDCNDAISQPLKLKLIDCHSRVVIAAPSPSVYAALSFVWGSVPSTLHGFHLATDGSPTALPPDLPRVVSDAISFTKALGLQYLWIDQLCIDQASEKHKHDQINQMNMIYRGAEVALIAAWGEGAEDGLMGVGPPRTSSQAHITVGDITLTSIWTDPQSPVIKSKWWTQGWTYQEAVLSRRRIFFTEQQVYFECGSITFQECLQTDRMKLYRLRNRDTDEEPLRDRLRDAQPHKLSHIVERFRSWSPTWSTQKYTVNREFLRPGLFNAVAGAMRSGSRTISSDACKIFRKHAVQYSARRLTFEDDSWKAFGGIARQIQTTEITAFHIWGLPFVFAVEDDHVKVKSSKKHIESFLTSLAWAHTKRNEGSGASKKRRHAFPSWTWIGWAGEIRFKPTKVMLSINHPSAVYLEVSAKDAEKTLYPLEDVSYSNADLLAFPQALHLDAWLYVPTACTPADPPAISTWKYGAADATFWPSKAILSSTTHVKAFHKQNYSFLLLGTEFRMTYFMVIEAVDDTTASFSRVGLMGVWERLETLMRQIRIENRRIRLI